MSSAAENFRAGFTWILLTFAAANAVSYFVRSDGLGNMLGTQPGGVEAIGFPWLIWAQRGSAGTYELNSAGLACDVAVTIAVAGLAGILVAWFRRRQPVRTAQPAPPVSVSTPTQSRKLQFSLRSLFLVAVVEALVFGAIRASVDARPVLLLLIYLLGPGVIIGVAYRLRHVVPAQRTAVLAVTVLLFIPAAAALGETIAGIGDFTKGILGLFIFWVPQCVLILAVVLVWNSALSGNR